MLPKDKYGRPFGAAASCHLDRGIGICDHRSRDDDPAGTGQHRAKLRGSGPIGRPMIEEQVGIF
jgi:hypothetical protein